MTGPARPGAKAQRRGIRRCPTCRAPTAVEWRPFCSKRCADADLGRWLAGEYRIPVVEDESDVDDAEAGEDGEGQR